MFHYIKDDKKVNKTKVKKCFIPTKILPVTLSVDHRILSPHDFDLKKFTKLSCENNDEFHKYGSSI